MAVRSGAGTGVIVSLVVFVLTTIFMLVLALVFYSGKAKAVEDLAKAQNEKQTYIRANEQNEDRIQKSVQNAAANKQSVVGYVSDQNDDWKRFVAGDTAVTLASLQQEMPEVAEGSSVRATLDSTKRQLRAAEGDKNAMETQLAARDQELADIEESLRLARQNHEDEINEITSQVSAYREASEEYKTEIDALISELEGAEERFEDRYLGRIEELEEEVDRANRDAQRLRGRVQEYERVRAENNPANLQPEMMVDGQVIDVEPLNDLVFLDRGRDQHVTLGMTFEVYDDATSIGLPDRNGSLRRGKASIQVIKVGTSSCTGKITRSTPGRPVIKGNVVANAVYDPDLSYKFLVHGKFDVDGDGRPTEQEAEYLRGLVIEWGGEVVMGTELPGDLDFLVLGAMPPMPPPLGLNPTPIEIEVWSEQRQVRQVYETLFEQARSAQIPVLNANRFFILTGHTAR